MQNKFRNLNPKAKYHLDQLMIELHVASYAEGYEAGKVVADNAVVEPVEEVEHDGKVLRKVEREAKKGDYVRFSEEQASNTHYGRITANKFYEVITVRDEPRFITDELNSKYRVYENGLGRTKENVDVFEVANASPTLEGLRPHTIIFDEMHDVPTLTPNQQRAELIQRAKDFVEGQKKKNGDIEFIPVSTRFGMKGCSVEFVHKNNRVTCLLKGTSSKQLFAIGRSNCSPNDVFNLYIGQAISLARALQIDIPVEFLKAVQPSDVVVGHVVNGYCEIGGGSYYTMDKHFTLTGISSRQFNSYTYAERTTDWIEREEIGRIADDTNAIYEVQS